MKRILVSCGREMRSSRTGREEGGKEPGGSQEMGLYPSEYKEGMNKETMRELDNP